MFVIKSSVEQKVPGQTRLFAATSIGMTVQSSQTGAGCIQQHDQLSVKLVKVAAIPNENLNRLQLQPLGVFLKFSGREAARSSHTVPLSPISSVMCCLSPRRSTSINNLTWLRVK